MLQLTFSVTEEIFGSTEIVDLIQDGRNIPVNIYNKNDYVELRWKYEMNASVEKQFQFL